MRLHSSRKWLKNNVEDAFQSLALHIPCSISRWNLGSFASVVLPATKFLATRLRQWKELRRFLVKKISPRPARVCIEYLYRHECAGKPGSQDMADSSDLIHSGTHCAGYQTCCGDTRAHLAPSPCVDLHNLPYRSQSVKSLVSLLHRM